MRLVADPESGDLLPEHKQWSRDVGPLAAGSLVPEWFPDQNEEGDPLKPQERAALFASQLEALQPTRSDKPDSDSPSPAKETSTPHSVLMSLQQLRYGAHQGPTPTLG